MEMTAGYMPRVMVAEKRISASTKYGARLHRPPKPPLRIKTAHVRPGQPDPPDRRGIFTIHVVEIEGSLGQAFTPAEAGPRLTASRPKARRESRAEEIARLERELAELEAEAEDDGREPE